MTPGSVVSEVSDSRSLMISHKMRKTMVICDGVRELSINISPKLSIPPTTVSYVLGTSIVYAVQWYKFQH